MSFTVSRSALPPEHPGPIAVALRGDGTAWASGTTTFSLEGAPAGTAIVRQWVNGAGSATVVLATGSGTGPFAIGDGSTTAPMEVKAGVRLGTRGWWLAPIRRAIAP